MHRLVKWLRPFYPTRLPIGRREYVLGCLGVGLGLFLGEWLSRQTLGEVNPWFIAPMGASAILLYLVPASPLGQPWSMWVGNTVSALVGVACYQAWGDGMAVAALAAGAAAAAMLALRCLHPPGGAVALTAVLGGPAIHHMGYTFVAWPVGVNSAFLLLLALVFNNLSGRRYPHHSATSTRPHGTDDPLPSHRGFVKEDLDVALHSFGELLDIDRDDLQEILVRAQLQAQSRRWQSVRCQDIMARDVVRVAPEDTLDVAWHRLCHHNVQALPVTNSERELMGIVSLHDFVIGLSAPDPRQLPRMSHARSVADIMSTQVVTAHPEQPIAELVQGFSDGGLSHMPVVDAHKHVVGMVTQSDLVAALFTAPSQQVLHT